MQFQIKKKHIDKLNDNKKNTQDKSIAKCKNKSRENL